MSKKHFNAIAAAIENAVDQINNIYSAQESDGRKSAFIGIRAAAINIANVCADLNPRFDRNRFLTACGVVGGDK